LKNLEGIHIEIKSWEDNQLMKRLSF